MDDVRGARDILGPPHGTTPAANKDKTDPLRAVSIVMIKDGPYPAVSATYASSVTL